MTANSHPFRMVVKRRMWLTAIACCLAACDSSTTLDRTTLETAGPTLTRPSEETFTTTRPGLTGTPLSLFDGVNLAHWHTYLGKPSPSDEPLGRDIDPKKVFSVASMDGEPAIRVSGEVWGALVSKDQYCNFELQLEYKWGTATWPPLNALDSGVMVLSTGRLGAVIAGGGTLATPPGSGAFMVSMEYQLRATDVGGMYNLGPIAFTLASHVPGEEHEKDWNSVTITHRNNTLTFALNGVTVATGSDLTLLLPELASKSLSCGRLQLQSEGGEIFFRRIEISPLRRFGSDGGVRLV